jgi:hypothetical protein
MMEAARTSEMSVDIQLRTRQYIPEDSELHNQLLFIMVKCGVLYEVQTESLNIIYMTNRLYFQR